jgi:flagellar motor protein MotB
LKFNALSLAALVAIAGCSSTPEPPKVDDSVRRPVNSAQELKLQQCTGELSAAKIELTEAVHTATRASASAKAESLLGAQQAQACKVGAASGAAGNVVFILPFAHASSALSLGDSDGKRLMAAAGKAELIVIRGRTNAQADSPAETELARRRASNAAVWLVQGGVPSQRVRIQWQGAGDPLAGHDATSGAQRRVEIEIYASAPRVESLAGTNL